MAQCPVDIANASECKYSYFILDQIKGWNLGFKGSYMVSRIYERWCPVYINVQFQVLKITRASYKQKRRVSMKFSIQINSPYMFLSKCPIWIDFNLKIFGDINCNQFLRFKDPETCIPSNIDHNVIINDLTTKFKSTAFNNIVDKYFKNLVHAACEYYSLRDNICCTVTERFGEWCNLRLYTNLLLKFELFGHS